MKKQNTATLKMVLGWAMVVAFAVVAAEHLCGCPGLPKPDGCTPLATRCAPDGHPQVCSQTERWTEIGDPCVSVNSVCCRTTSPYGHELYACAAREKCEPEPADAGSEGGAP